jgi:transcription initiation factor TFIIIB Brf1 subunit/transcription initiation factor TFIIB
VAKSKIIDQGSEWRNFADSDKDRSRAQEYDPLFDSLASQTTITEQAFNSDNTKSGAGLSRVQKRVGMNTNQRNFIQAIEKINQFGELLQFTEHIKNRAKKIYKRFSDSKKKNYERYQDRRNYMCCSLLGQ